MCDKLLFAFIMVRRVQATASARARARAKVNVEVAARAGAVPEQSRAEQSRRWADCGEY